MADTTQASHTPGPWEAVPPQDDPGISINGEEMGPVPAHIRRVYIDEDGQRCVQIIADVYNGDSEEGADNAVLLARAPALLAENERLRAALHTLLVSGHSNDQGAFIIVISDELLSHTRIALEEGA